MTRSVSKMLKKLIFKFNFFLALFEIIAKRWRARLHWHFLMFSLRRYLIPISLNEVTKRNFWARDDKLHHNMYKCYTRRIKKK